MERRLRILTFTDIAYNASGDWVGVDPSSLLNALLENRSSTTSLYDETFLLEKYLQSPRCGISVEKPAPVLVEFRDPPDIEAKHTLSTHNPF